ncbi:response regulator transcription factor, partial [bacterium]|nr:response regulator transcription factor [bacterium]
MKILIVDDHRLFREALKTILGSELADATFGEARTAPEALASVGAQPWDLVILDITMPGRSGLEVLTDLKLARPALPVLVVTGNPEEQFAVRMLKAGAAGYLTKDSSSAELVAAIQKISRGGQYITPAVAECLATHIRTGTDKPLHETLSDREFSVLRLLGTGKSVSGISRELSLSVKTVSTYRRRLLQKLRLTSTAELVH